MKNCSLGERYDFVINADQEAGAYWIQARGLGECGIRRVQQLAVLRYVRAPFEPSGITPTYDDGLPQGIVSKMIFLDSKISKREFVQDFSKKFEHFQK